METERQHVKRGQAIAKFQGHIVKEKWFATPLVIAMNMLFGLAFQNTRGKRINDNARMLKHEL